MPRTTRSTNKPQSLDRDAIIAAAVEAALAALTPEAKPKGKATPKATTERTYDLSKAATRSQVFRAFFAMAKAHHGLTFKSDEWPTSGDIQSIIDSIGA